MVLAYDPVDTTANGTDTHACACGATIPSHKKWCSEACRNRHRQRDDRSPAPTGTGGAAAPPAVEIATPETWTFGQVVAELVTHGLVVDLEIEGIALRLSAAGTD